jgi:hypothetical protein
MSQLVREQNDLSLNQLIFPTKTLKDLYSIELTALRGTQEVDWKASGACRGSVIM